MPVPALAAAAAPAAVSAFSKVAPAAVSAIGSLIGGLFGSSSNERINERNIEMQRETNAQNYKIFQEQMAYNTDMWNKQRAWDETMWNRNNAYNDPQQQVYRLLKAGINPAFQGGVSSSVASAIQGQQATAPSAVSMQSARAMPYDFAPVLNNAVNAAQNSVNAYYQNRLIDRQGHKVDAERQRLESVTPFELKLLENQAKSEGWKGDIARTELVYLQAVNGQRISQAFGDTRLQNAQLKQASENLFQTQLTNALYQVELSWKDKMNRAQFNLIGNQIQEVIANIALTAARRDLTMQQKLTEVENTLDRKLGNDMKRIDYQFYDDFKAVALDRAYQEYETQDLINEKQRNINRYGEAGIRLFGSALPELESDLKNSFIGRNLRKGWNWYKRASKPPKNLRSFDNVW